MKYFCVAATNENKRKRKPIKSDKDITSQTRIPWNSARLSASVVFSLKGHVFFHHSLFHLFYEMIGF
ncbi:hypothetical protein FF1_041361 [Malus domestica]